MSIRFTKAAAIMAAGAALFALGAARAGEMVPTPRGDTQSSTLPITTVLELFTSQGCSSCPPADAVLKTYAENPSVMALSLPVDYWDYLGWKDTFATPRNADRQRAYAKARGDGAIYTPQLVVNGMLHVNGANKADIDNAIELDDQECRAFRMYRSASGRNRAHSTSPLGGTEAGRETQEATIWLALVQPTGTVDIQKGENAGNKLTYTNIVHELTPVGLWKGQPILIQIPRAAVMQAATQKSVVFVQEGKAGPILGAAWAGLW